MTTTSASAARAVASRSRSAAVGVSTSSTPAGRRHREVCGEQRHVGAAPACLRRERHAHPSRRAVADEADRVERLARAAGRDEHPLPTQRTVPHEQGARGAEDLLRLGHPPHAELSLGRLALVRPEEDDAAHAQRLGIRAGRRDATTCRGFIAGATSTGPRCASAASVRTLSESPCASLASVFAVHGATTRRSARVEVEVDVVSRRTPRERLKRLGGDEALGARRDEGNDLVALLHEQPAQLARLVGGDAAGHPQEDAGHARMMPDFRTRIEMKHGLTGRAGRHDPASSVAQIALLFALPAPCLALDHPTRSARGQSEASSYFA